MAHLDVPQALVTCIVVVKYVLLLIKLVLIEGELILLLKIKDF